MNNISDERVGELRSAVHEAKHGEALGSDERDDLLSILSSYSSMRAEHERLREWSKKLEASHASLEERFRKAEAQLAKVAPLVNALLRIANETIRAALSKPTTKVAVSLEELRYIIHRADLDVTATKQEVISWLREKGIVIEEAHV